MRIGIVGSESAKFTKSGEAQAKAIIRHLLTQPEVDGVVSGGCHLGGIDIWAQEIGKDVGITVTVHKPKFFAWQAYKYRNLLIACDSHIVHCITVKNYPLEYAGMKFTYCYHCKTSDHIKSGGCWTMKKAKTGQLHVIDNFIDSGLRA